MNILPKLTNEILGKERSEIDKIEVNRTLQPMICKPKHFRPALDSRQKDRCAFKPLKIVGDNPWIPKAKTSGDYAWTPVHKFVSSSTIVSSNDDASCEVAASDAQLPQNADNMIETPKSEPTSAPIEEAKGDLVLNDDLLLNFEADIALKRPKPVSDKKLAVRSDVVNKTLLRSLKRYYTAKFEEETGYKRLSKDQQKKQIRTLLTDFTMKIYEGDTRFALDEFSKVSMDDLVFYMGICINPMYMKGKTATSKQRVKFQAFYN